MSVEICVVGPTHASKTTREKTTGQKYEKYCSSSSSVTMGGGQGGGGRAITGATVVHRNSGVDVAVVVGQLQVMATRRKPWSKRWAGLWSRRVGSAIGTLSVDDLWHSCRFLALGSMRKGMAGIISSDRDWGD